MAKLRLGSDLEILQWFARNPFARLGICYLHESLWGNFKRHVVYLRVKYGQKFQDQVHQRLRNIQWYPTLRKKLKCLYVQRYDFINKKQIIDLKCYTAEHLHCFIQVSPYCFYGIINDFDFYVWMLHLQADSIISKESVTRTDLDTLEYFTFMWREGFKLSFGADVDSELESEEKEAILTSEFLKIVKMMD